MDEPVADAIRRACLRVATDAHQDAGLRGLCAEGRFEAAMDAVRSLDLTRAVDAVADGPPSSADADPAGGAAQREWAAPADEVGS